jgi:HK97 family phage portal protein
MPLKHDVLITPRHRTITDLGLPAGAYEFSTGRRVQAGKYGKSPWAFACMHIRGSELANLPWRLVKKGGEIVTSHPIIDLLTNFGEESNYPESVSNTEIDLLLTAAGYWLNDGDRLQRLDPNPIKVVATADGIQRFEQWVDGRLVNRFAREEIVYFHEYNPDGDLLPGVPVMEVIKHSVAVEYESGLYVEAFFKNDATPSILLSTDQTIQEPEMNKVLAWWNKTFRGSRQSHKVGFADKGLKATILSSALRELALVEIRDQARRDICAAMRVPFLLVGAIEDSSWANAKVARRFLLEDTIIPRSQYYAGVINADLVRRIDPNVRFEFVPGDLQILQEDSNEKWTRLDSAVELGAISLEFARQQMGWPETAAPAKLPELDQVDLRAWRRKAQNALKAGRSADVEFQTGHVDHVLQQAIRARLAGAQTPAQVEEAFNGRH